MFVARAGATDSAGFLWRLIWSNNRELGRGGYSAPTFGACREAVLTLRAHYTEAVGRLIVDEATGHWTWRLEADRVVLATRGREYLRERECRASLRTFLEAVPIALVSDHAVAIEPRMVRR
ncbi:hypothetical protein [Hamadaea tsunoensis]|uniref:hypothetical protein n=1 Tax=Hamadaea tsunoensis TaxID=53368 RepID=UPI0012FA110B|nr:hypothetical protein [Hamadaea tsunoensis]